ncbi:MAG: type II toxin-antitoxin system HicB family antitoxin [Desulfovibrio desulfuricans]|nr:type II toxin-antitoxin system HicB family antitoxin [Desulfovibrio desulfuricans]
MDIAMEFDREEDGRWIAEVPSLPGVMAYGATRDDAGNRALALALRVVADKLENGEYPHPMHSISVSRHEPVAVR